MEFDGDLDIKAREVEDLKKSNDDLTRQAAMRWADSQIDPMLPAPPFFIQIVGGIGKGKTTIILNMLREYQRVNTFCRVIYLSPSGKNDPKLRMFLTADNSNFDYTADNLNSIIKEIETDNAALKGTGAEAASGPTPAGGTKNLSVGQIKQRIQTKIPAKIGAGASAGLSGLAASAQHSMKTKEDLAKDARKKVSCRTLIIADDATGSILTKRDSPFVKFLVSIRHMDASVILCTHSETSLSAQLRNIVTGVVLFEPGTGREMKSIVDDVGGVSQETLTGVLSHVQRVPHGFVFVDKKRPFKDRFILNFKQALDPDFFDKSASKDKNDPNIQLFRSGGFLPSAGQASAMESKFADRAFQLQQEAMSMNRGLTPADKILREKNLDFKRKRVVQTEAVSSRAKRARVAILELESRTRAATTAQKIPAALRAQSHAAAQTANRLSLSFLPGVSDAKLSKKTKKAFAKDPNKKAAMVQGAIAQGAAGYSGVLNQRFAKGLSTNQALHTASFSRKGGRRSAGSAALGPLAAQLEDNIRLQQKMKNERDEWGKDQEARQAETKRSEEAKARAEDERIALQAKLDLIPPAPPLPRQLSKMDIALQQAAAKRGDGALDRIRREGELTIAQQDKLAAQQTEEEAAAMMMRDRRIAAKREEAEDLPDAPEIAPADPIPIPGDVGELPDAPPPNFEPYEEPTPLAPMNQDSQSGTNLAPMNIDSSSGADLANRSKESRLPDPEDIVLPPPPPPLENFPAPPPPLAEEPVVKEPIVVPAPEVFAPLARASGSGKFVPPTSTAKGKTDALVKKQADAVAAIQDVFGDVPTPPIVPATTPGTKTKLTKQQRNAAKRAAAEADAVTAMREKVAPKVTPEIVTPAPVLAPANNSPAIVPPAIVPPASFPTGTGLPSSTFSSTPVADRVARRKAQEDLLIDEDDKPAKRNPAQRIPMTVPIPVNPLNKLEERKKSKKASSDKAQAQRIAAARGTDPTPAPPPPPADAVPVQISPVARESSTATVIKSIGKKPKQKTGLAAALPAVEAVADATGTTVTKVDKSAISNLLKASNQRNVESKEKTSKVLAKLKAKNAELSAAVAVREAAADAAAAAAAPRRTIAGKASALATATATTLAPPAPAVTLSKRRTLEDSQTSDLPPQVVAAPAPQTAAQRRKSQKQPALPDTPAFKEPIAKKKNTAETVEQVFTALHHTPVDYMD